MKITFAPRGILQIDDAKLIYKNFAGVSTQFNREGDRNFSLRIEDVDLADELKNQGWNVKIKAPREEGDIPFMHLPVKVKFNNRGPNCYLVTRGKQVKLDEESVDCLDDVDIEYVELDIRPYDWEVNGKAGRTAYLQSIRVTQRSCRFAVDEDEAEDM